MITAIDHLVITGDDLDDLSARYGQLGFALTPGSSCAPGIRNAFVCFADGSYLELQIREAQTVPGIPPSQPGRGLAECWLASDDLEGDVWHLQRQGLRYRDPVTHSIPRVYARESRWLEAIPDEAGLPTLIQYVVDRHVRIPTEPPGHLNGATGIRRLAVLVTDAAATLDRYRRILGDPIAPRTLEAGPHHIVLREAESTVERESVRDADGPFSIELRGRGRRVFDPDEAGGVRLSVAG